MSFTLTEPCTFLAYSPSISKILSVWFLSGMILIYLSVMPSSVTTLPFSSNNLAFIINETFGNTSSVFPSLFLSVSTFLMYKFPVCLMFFTVAIDVYWAFDGFLSVNFEDALFQVYQYKLGSLSSVWPSNLTL